ncbi:galactosylgalactosylxylosylprotein 3-beta-glucuronosyltransferase S-like [Haemaphysalis longicornis]
MVARYATQLTRWLMRTLTVLPTIGRCFFQLMAAALCVNAVLLFVGFWTWPHPLTETPAATKKPVPTVYVVTPTHRQATQIPNLYRLAHALMLATNVFWVLVEDAVRPTKAVSRLLEECGIPHVHLLGPCPRSLRGKGRGVSARNAGIQWLQRHASQPGVVYFADDDNTYDHRIFDEIRRTEGVSVFPVGAMREKGLSTPVVHEGRVIGFYDPWFGGRIFPLDMAGFAVNLRLVVNNRDLRMPYETGYLETKFLEAVGISSLADLEPLCDNASKEVSEIGRRWSVLGGFPGLGMRIILDFFHSFGGNPVIQHSYYAEGLLRLDEVG